MKRFLHLLPLFILFAFFSSCTKDNTVDNRFNNPSEAQKFITSADNRFGLKIFKAIAAEAEEKDKNIFISPLSISLAFGMAMNGAAGPTLDEMKSTLELSGMTDQQINEAFKSITDMLTSLDPKVAFQIANSIWYDLGFKPADEFQNVNKKYYNSETATLDLQAPETLKIINKWVSDHTNAKIPEMLDFIFPETKMILLNAIYFKGDWKYQFEKENTKLANFYTGSGTTKQCYMMKLGDRFKYYDCSDYSAIDMPYGDSIYSMTVVLPKGTNTIDGFIAGLTNESFNSIIANMENDTVQISMPRFKLKYGKELIEILKSLGMRLAFGDADFSRITGCPNGLSISRVLHKSFVDVNEEGTEAAAATEIEFTWGSSSTRFTVDKPFVFTIRENRTGTILFIGKIIDPALEM